MKKTEKMIAAEKAFNIVFTEDTMIADAIIDKELDGDLTKEEVKELLPSLSKGAQQILCDFYRWN